MALKSCVRASVVRGALDLRIQFEPGDDEDELEEVIERAISQAWAEYWRTFNARYPVPPNGI